MRKFSFQIIFASMLSLFFTACQSDSKAPAEESSSYHLGDARLEVTGAESAVPHFQEGLLLLHSFEYADARTAFQKAKEEDADFVMAYWGEAMTHNRGLWRSQDYEEGQAVLAQLGDTPGERMDKAATELEKDLLKGVEILYGEGTKYERDQAYADHMGQLYKKYPDHQEVAAFYALSLLGSVPVGRDEEVYEQSAAIAQSILIENPKTASMRSLITILMFILAGLYAYGQGTLEIDGKYYPYTFDDCGDTLILATFADIPVTSLAIFNSKEDRRRYDKYREYAAKVYPYAAEAIRVFRKMEEDTEGLKNRKKKKYIRQLKKDLKDKFSDPLKSLTKIQGKILIKMIERELDTPLYHLIKDLRGGLNATYWNFIGSLYGHKLKEGYLEGEDPILDAVLDDMNLIY